MTPVYLMIRYRLLFTLFTLLLSWCCGAQEKYNQHQVSVYDSLQDLVSTAHIKNDTILRNRLYERHGKLLLNTATVYADDSQDYYDNDYVNFDSVVVNDLQTDGFRSVISTNSKINKFIISETLREISFDNTKINDLIIYSREYDSVFISIDSKCKLDSVEIKYGIISIHDQSQSGLLFFHDCTIEYMAFDSLPKTLILQKITFSNELVLGGVYGHTSNLGLDQIDINKLVISNYENFKLDFNWRNFSYDETVDTYARLLENFRSKNQQRNYEKLDKEFQAFKLKELGFFGHIVNWVTRVWWDYGYNKHLVLLRALQLNMFFFIINLFLYMKLLNEGYQLLKFAEMDLELRKKYGNSNGLLFLARIPYVFLYTGYIFWGWKLELQSINIRNVLLFSYVLLQYLTGIVCLGYIVNLVITR